MSIHIDNEDLLRAVKAYNAAMRYSSIERVRSALLAYLETSVTDKTSLALNQAKAEIKRLEGVCMSYDVSQCETCL